MIYPSQSNQVIEKLNSRKIKIYHACQLKDFKTYLKLGGVPSRRLMKDSELPFTPFDTDLVDSQNDVWDKVFGNFSDFGYGFYHYMFGETTAPTPNPYGPILLVFSPDVIRVCEDISITLRSAGAKNFDRNTESITLSELDDIFYFQNLNECDSNAKLSRIASGPILNERFGVDYAKNPEINSKIREEIFPWEYLQYIICDPIRLNNVYLKKKLESYLLQSGIQVRVFERGYAKEERVEMINEIVDYCVDTEFHLTLTSLRNADVSESLGHYLNLLSNGQMDFFFSRYLKYIQSGTLKEWYDDSAIKMNDSTYELTYKLVLEKKSIEEISAIRQLKKETISNHITQLMKEDNASEFLYLIPNSEILFKVYLGIIDQLENITLKPIYERWDKNITYDEIKLALSFFNIYGHDFIYSKLNSIQKTMIRLKQGNSLSDISNERGLQYSTLLEHMKYVKQHLLLTEIQHIRPDKVIIDRIEYVALSLSEKPTLREIYDACLEEISFDEIKLAYPFVFS